MNRSGEVRSALQNTYAYVSVESVFDGVAPTIEDLSRLLSSLPQAETLLWCGRCNGVLTGLGPETRDARQEILAFALLGRREIERINGLTVDWRNLRHTTPVLPFFRGQMLELARWAARFSPMADFGDCFSDPETRSRFAAAAFIAGEILAKRIGEDKLVVPHDVRVFSDESTAFSIGAVAATASSTHPWRVLGRGLKLLRDYYPRYDSELDSRLRSATGVSVEEYQTCIASLVPSFLWLGKKGSYIDLTRVGDRPPFAQLFRTFAASQSQTAEELRVALWGIDSERSYDDPRTWSLQPLRTRPIIRDTWERAVIIDGRIWEEKAAVGALFDSIRDGSGDEARHVLGAFGKAFEDYACDLLIRCLEHEDGYDSSQCTRNLRLGASSASDSEIDLAYRSKRQLYLYEVKATFLREDKGHDPDMFLEHVDAKYVERSGVKSETRRALEQLADASLLIAESVLSESGDEFSSVSLIHPMLVVYDSALSSPKVGEYLAGKYEEMIAPDEVLDSGQMRKGSLRFAQLTVVTAEDLENLRDSVKHFPLSRLLVEYEQNCPARFLSLHDYIATSRFAKMLEPDRDLVESARAMLGDIAVQAFGKSLDDDE